jgi:hypothetical protein|tara:strand:+ start:665 stop:1075 length:411 start_codon:yes stop_codon:yes gene_type:complete
MSEFDVDSILNATVSSEEFEGKKPLAAEGTYPGCLIKSVDAYEPNEFGKAKGVKARLRFKFECPSKDIELSHYINYKDVNHARSTYMKLVKALWPNKEDAVSKTTRDMIGQTVDIFVSHEEGDYGAWADYKFTPSN